MDPPRRQQSSSAPWKSSWPLPEFLEILLEINRPMQIRLSRNFHANMQVLAEMWVESRGSARGCRVAASLQPAAGEENFAQYRQIPSKINAFCHASPGFQPWRRIDTEIFGLQPTYQSVRRPRMGCADFLSRVVAEISRNISGKKVVVARKAFPERRRCTRGNSGKGQATPEPCGFPN